MQFKQAEECILLFARTNIDPSIIPPFQVIIPALSMIAPLTIYTGLGHKIESDNLY
jgi:hypothetical protein